MNSKVSPKSRVMLAFRESAGALVAQLAHLHNVAQLAFYGVSLVVGGAVLFGSGVLFEMRANPNQHDDGNGGLKAAPRQTITS